jgi:predicted ATPase/class 3 adenylate cyclase
MTPVDLPRGTVTFLFTDVEGSTKLLHELGPEAYAEALAGHRAVIREAAESHGGVEVDTQGDAFFIAFPTAPGALAAAAAARDALRSGPIRVRMGLHSGAPLVTEEGYVGPDVHRAARIAAAGHGGQILASASTSALVGDEPLRDLGPHRLKDLSAPERIFQVGDDDFPPLKSLHQTNLPIPATPFLGRDAELPEVLQLLSRDDVRLLTLTGPGGTGKTRLAAQAAGLLADRYADGVWWVPLAPLRDSQLVLPTASQMLGAKNGVADHIGDKSMLVLFDNFEQVVDAAPDVAQLLTSCSNLDVLVTSREPLHVTGEQEYAVPPLVDEEGVDFFVARARAITPDFKPDESVSAICRRLDDLPLALELAAARVKALTTEQILERLEQRLPLLTGGARDLPERQRTLRAAIEWSYELLDEPERQLFGRLGVFRGGCTLEAAEAAADADVETLQSLVDKSLLRHIGDRYWMLETIREYANELADNEMRRRHADYFIELAEEADPHLRGDPGEWLDRLEGEHNNFRAALDWLATAGETQLSLRLAGSLQRFWFQKGHFAEGVRRLESALGADESPTAARAKALDGSAMLTIYERDTHTGAKRAEEALALHEALGDEWGSANSLSLFGHALADEGEFWRARPIFEEALRRFRAVGDKHYILLTQYVLAWMYGETDDPEGDQELLERTLREARAAGNKRMTALALRRVSMHASAEGRFDEALAMLHEAYTTYKSVGDRSLVGDVLTRIASVLVARGKPTDAARVLSKGDTVAREMALRRRPVLERVYEETLAAIRNELDEETFARAWDEGRALTEDEAAAQS